MLCGFHLRHVLGKVENDLNRFLARSFIVEVIDVLFDLEAVADDRLAAKKGRRVAFDGEGYLAPGDEE